MSGDQAPAHRPIITVAEMNGRTEELERQRNEALTRCASLAGTNALLRRTLTEARDEIERLNSLIPPPIAPGAAPDPAETQTPH